MLDFIRDNRKITICAAVVLVVVIVLVISKVTGEHDCKEQTELCSLQNNALVYCDEHFMLTNDAGEDGGQIEVEDNLGNVAVIQPNASIALNTYLMDKKGSRSFKIRTYNPKKQVWTGWSDKSRKISFDMTKK